MTKTVFWTTFGKHIPLKYSSMFCNYDKPMLSVLGSVLYKLQANKKFQVSVVVKYILTC